VTANPEFQTETTFGAEEEKSQNKTWCILKAIKLLTHEHAASFNKTWNKTWHNEKAAAVQRLPHRVRLVTTYLP